MGSSAKEPVAIAGGDDEDGLVADPHLSAVVPKEDAELDREEAKAKNNCLSKVCMSSLSFDLPMLDILLTHPCPRHHLPPFDLLIWEYTSTSD